MKYTEGDKAQLAPTIMDIIAMALGLFFIGVFMFLNGIMLDPVAEAVINTGGGLSAERTGIVNNWYVAIVKWGPILAGGGLLGFGLFRAWRRGRRSALVPGRPPR